MNLSKARDWSLLGKIAAGAVALAGLALKGLGILELQTLDILAVAGFIAGVFLPIDANLLAEKIFRHG
jgi:hypothetical protein